MKAEELIKILKDHPKVEVKVLGYKPQPIKIETAYYEKTNNMVIIEAD